MHNFTTIKTDETMSLMDINFQNASLTELENPNDGLRTWVGEKFSIKENPANPRRPYQVRLNGKRARSFQWWAGALAYGMESHNEYWKK